MASGHHTQYQGVLYYEETSFLQAKATKKDYLETALIHLQFSGAERMCFQTQDSVTPVNQTGSTDEFPV